MSGSWLDQLQPASWRGVPFAVRSSGIGAGRDTAVHQYPFRDSVLVEDLGKKSRSYSFRGFLVGDDCYQQEQRMLDAVEAAGTGELVHPSLGSRTVSLIEFSSGQDAEAGRAVSLDFRFIEGGAVLSPGLATATGDAVDDAADDADTASSDDLASDIGSAVAEGAAVVQGAVATVSGFVSQVQDAIGDAGLLVHSVANIIPGVGQTLGRFAGGALNAVNGVFGEVAGAAGAITGAASSIAAQTQNALAAATRAQTAVGNAIGAAQQAAAGL